MKKFGKFKLFGLLIFLSVALVFVGGNFLEGQKGRPPGDRVYVHIPLSGSGHNLYGIGTNKDGIYYDDDTYIFAGSGKGLRKNPDYPYYHFELTICNTKSWGDPCGLDEEYPIPGVYTVGFEGISIDPDSVVYPGEEGEKCCCFPPAGCWPEPDPSCMEYFLNNWEHPSSWECVDGENKCYMGAYIKIKVFDEIWNYDLNVATPAKISLYISVYTGIVAPEEEDFYHDIEIHKPENVTYWANVTRLDEDSYKIVFDPTEATLVEFRETHEVLLGEPKGKSGKHYEYEERTTMIATANHFSFEISWIYY